MAALLDPLVDALAEKQGSRPGALATAIGSRATGVQAGGLLAFLSSRVLGQYEIFGTGGRLLLVAPNIVATERKLGRRPVGLPAVGLPARGHPPAAVHRRAVAARLPRVQIAAFVEATDLTPRCCGSGCRTCCAASPTPSAAATASPRGCMALVRTPRSAPSSTGSPR